MVVGVHSDLAFLTAVNNNANRIGHISEYTATVDNLVKSKRNSLAITVTQPLKLYRSALESFTINSALYSNRPEFCYSIGFTIATILIRQLLVESVALSILVQAARLAGRGYRIPYIGNFCHT